MPAEFLNIHPINPEGRKISKVVNVLKEGGLIIYPTDTVYGIGCDLMNRRAIQRLCQVIHIKPQKLNLSFICKDISQMATYVKRIDTPIFKILKKKLPGPYTFIFESSSSVPKMLDINKTTVGLRVPNHPIPLSLVNVLMNPLINASLKHSDTIKEYMTDPDEIYEAYKNHVNVIIDGGPGGNIPSSVIDCTLETLSIVRIGAGTVEDII